MAHQELQVTIKTEGGQLTLSPIGLLSYFVPDAKPMPNNPRVFEGHVPGRPDKKCYVQVEALAAMLMKAQEKRINPISGMHLIASSSPDRPAGHKIDYKEGLTRARNIPGFLGMNAGLIVKREKQFVETHGTVPFPGDDIIGAWAEAYIRSMPRPIRHEVPKQGFWGTGPNWDQKGGWMLCKVAMDQLAVLKLGALGADGEAAAELQDNPDDIVLEAQPRPPASQQMPAAAAANDTQQPPPQQPQEPEFEFQPEKTYSGILTQLSARNGQTPAHLTVQTEYGDLGVSFWERPTALKEKVVDGKTVAMSPEEWPALLHSLAKVSFVPDKKGYPILKTFTFDTAPSAERTEREPGED